MREIEFKKGDKVFCIRNGHGVVIEIRNNSHPVQARFHDTINEYKADGKEYKEDAHPILFHSAKEASEYFAKVAEEEGKLTFEKIRKELVPMKHLLIAEDGRKRLYLGFSREGNLILDRYDGHGCSIWGEYTVKDWTYEEYKGEE